MQPTAPPTTLLATIDSGPRGILQTLKVMRQLVIAGKKHPLVRECAASLTMCLPQKDYTGEIGQLFDFVQNNIRYVRDIRGVETLHTADKILSQEYGDCDDKCILLGALLESISHPTRFIACGFKPNSISHVFLDTKVGKNRWLSLDATEPYPMGWRPPDIVCILDPIYN